MSLLVPAASGFGKFADNYGSTYTQTGLGTAIAAHNTAHTKSGVTTSLIAGSSVIDDVYGISIRFQDGFLSGEARRFMTDIYVDPAGGTAWESAPRIENLLTNCCSMIMGGTEYFFPLYIPKGASIGAQCQSSTASAPTIRVATRVFMAPDSPWAAFAGKRVKTFGAVTASTSGKAFTPGASGAKGSYSATLGPTADELWWWQLGVCSTDTSQTAVQYFMDLAFGDASNKYLAVFDAMHVNVGTTENASFPKAGGSGLPWRRAPSGSEIYIRGACTGTADNSWSGVAYGMGD